MTKLIDIIWQFFVGIFVTGTYIISLINNSDTTPLSKLPIIVSIMFIFVYPSFKIADKIISRIFGETK